MENPFKTYFLLEKGGIFMNMFLLLEGTPRKFNSSPLKIGLLPKGNSSSNHHEFQGRAVKFRGCKAVFFLFCVSLRCVLDDLNNAPGEALSSLLGALTRQERRKIDVEVMARDGWKW